MNSNKTELVAPFQTFFEDPTKQPSKLWLKPNLTEDFKGQNTDIFFKRKSKISKFEKRIYTFTKDFLFYRKVSSF